MTARLPARYGAQTSLPSMVQDSVSDWSQAWLFSKSPRLPLRSWSAPAAAYLETRVLPSSTTSGGLEPAQAATPRTRATARARTAERRWRRELGMDLPPCCWDGGG